MLPLSNELDSSKVSCCGSSSISSFVNWKMSCTEFNVITEFLFGFGVRVQRWKFLKKVVDGARKFMGPFAAVTYRCKEFF